MPSPPRLSLSLSSSLCSLRALLAVCHKSMAELPEQVFTALNLINALERLLDLESRNVGSNAEKLPRPPFQVSAKKAHAV